MSDIENEPPFVLALTIVRGTKGAGSRISKDHELLVCVRNKDVNKTHPEVLSVPTQRIPSVLAKRILEQSRGKVKKGKTLLFDSMPVSSEDAKGHNELLYIVESLLAKKLGVADPLEAKELAFEIVLAGNQTGVANYPNLVNDDHPSSEALQMLNVEVHIAKGEKCFPKRTVSYDDVEWVSVREFYDMGQSAPNPKDQDPTKLGFSGMGVCVDGLCISSTADIICSHLED